MAFDKTVYEKAEKEIVQRRFKADSEAELRISEIERKLPEIAETRRKLSQTSVELSKLIIERKGNVKENIEKIKSRNLEGQKIIHSILTQNNYPADYLEPVYTCRLCRDKGFVDGERCSCFDKLLTHFAVEKLNSEANMPNCDFEHFSLSYYQGYTADDGRDCYNVMKDNLSFCKEYAKHFSLRAPSLFLYGKTGVGKTHISLSIAREVSKQGYNAAYGSLLNYLRIIEKEHFGRSEDPEADTLQLLINTDLLVLDDLGSEFRTNFYESVIYNIINSRINLGLPTIINSNLSYGEFQKLYNDRINSRLFSTYQILMFVGRDVRSLKRINDEI